MRLRLKRVYDDPDAADGARVLVDRLWPRGISRDRAALTLWARDLGPSTALRQWFGHDPARFAEFARRYRAELAGQGELLAELRALGEQHGALTLLYSARDEQHNQAVVLAEVLRG